MQSTGFESSCCVNLQWELEPSAFFPISFSKGHGMVSEVSSRSEPENLRLYSRHSQTSGPSARPRQGLRPQGQLRGLRNLRERKSGPTRG